MRITHLDFVFAFGQISKSSGSVAVVLVVVIHRLLV
jgi:hypothetical protein